MLSFPEADILSENFIGDSVVIIVDSVLVKSARETEGLILSSSVYPVSTDWACSHQYTDPQNPGEVTQ